MLLRHHPLVHSIVAIRPRDLVEGTGSFLVLDLGLKCLLDLGPMCVILLLKLVDLSLTQCYCLFSLLPRSWSSIGASLPSSQSNIGAS